MSSLHAVPDTPERAVLYGRQSVAREESISLEVQERANRDHSLRNGYTVVRTLTDPGISGGTFNRPGIREAYRMLEAGEADVLVVWRWSRLSRRRLDWAAALDRAEQAGCRVESSTEPVDVSTSSGRFARGVLGELAAFQREQISDGWKEAHQHRRAVLGLPAQGGERFGYRQVRELVQARGGDRLRTVAYEQVEPEAGILAWMYRQVIGGTSTSAVAKAMQERGLVTTSGGPWSQDRVADVLDAGWGAGLIVHRPGRKRPVYYAGAHQGVITSEEWTAYLQARRAIGWTPARVRAPVYPLSGLVRCECGSRMAACGRRDRRQWRCGRWFRLRDVPMVTVLVSRTEAAVMEWLDEHARDVDGAAQRSEAEVARTRLRTEHDVAACEREVAELHRQLGQLTVQLVRELVPEAGYTAARDVLTEQLDQAQRRLAAASQDRRPGPSPETRRMARHLIDEWSELPVATRRDMLASLIDRVQVTRSGSRRDGNHLRVVSVWEAAEEL